MYPLATNGRFSRNSFQYISYPDMDLHPDSFPTDVEFAKLVITFASLSVFSIPHKMISLFIPGGETSNTRHKSVEK